MIPTVLERVDSAIEMCTVLAEIKKQGAPDASYLKACDDIAALIRAQKATYPKAQITPGESSHG